MRLLSWALPLATVVVIGAAGVAVYEGITEWFRRGKPTTESKQDSPPFALKTGAFDAARITSPEETFDRRDPLKFWKFDFGTTVSQIKVKAFFNYQVPLDPKGWNVKTVGREFRVVVPAVRPLLPVAIDTSTLQKKTRAGWLRFNKDENLEALEKDLTAQLEIRATDKKNIELQRPKAREAVRDFVANWMVRRAGWPEVKPSQIHVFFEDEPIGALDASATNF